MCLAEFRSSPAPILRYNTTHSLKRKRLLLPRERRTTRARTDRGTNESDRGKTRVSREQAGVAFKGLPRMCKQRWNRLAENRSMPVKIRRSKPYLSRRKRKHFAAFARTTSALVVVARRFRLSCHWPKSKVVLQPHWCSRPFFFFSRLIHISTVRVSLVHERVMDLYRQGICRYRNSKNLKKFLEFLYRQNICRYGSMTCSKHKQDKDQRIFLKFFSFCIVP